MKHCWLVGALALVLAAPAWSQNVHVVAGSGGGDFIQVYSAAAAAADGDVILVLPDTDRYDFAIINGKALTIVGIGPVRPEVEDLHVKNLPAGKTVTLRNLDLEGRIEFVPPGIVIQKPGLHLVSNQGCVWMEDLVVTGGSGAPKLGGYEDGAPGFVAQQSVCVVAVDSAVAGGQGFWSVAGTSWPGGDGALLSLSQVALHGCTIVGGTGGQGVISYPGPGGVGMDTAASTLFASGSSLSGGDTGVDVGIGPSPIPTAAGLVAHNNSTVKHLATALAAGSGPAPPGTPVTTDLGSTVDDLDDAHRALKVPAVVREGGEALVTYSGEPGDLVLLRFSSAADWTLATPLKGVQHLGATAFDVFLGDVGRTGILDVTFRAPLLPPGIEAVTGFAQPLVAEADGSLRIGSPSSVLIVDASIPLP